MRMTRSGLAAASLAAALLLAPSHAPAQTAAERAAERRKTEERIGALEAKLAQLGPVSVDTFRSKGEAGLSGDLAFALRVEMAKRHLELARKVLGHNNERAASVLTDLAERSLAQAVPKRVEP